MGRRALQERAPTAQAYPIPLLASQPKEAAGVLRGRPRPTCPSERLTSF